MDDAPVRTLTDDLAARCLAAQAKSRELRAYSKNLCSEVDLTLRIVRRARAARYTTRLLTRTAVSFEYLTV